MLNHPCSPGMNLNWSWWIIFLMSCWILFARILLRILASIFISDIGLKFFLVGSLPGLGIWVMLASKRVEVFLLLQFFLFFKQLQENMCYFFFENLVEFPRESIKSLALVFWEVFDHHFNLVTRYWSIQVVNFFLVQFQSL